MAITNTLSSIKDYFVDWHNKNYEVLHKIPLEAPLNSISNNSADDKKLVTNKAVRDKINNSITNISNSNVTVNGQTKTIQTTLNDFYSELTTTVKKNDVAYYAPFDNDFYSSVNSSRGFTPYLDTSKCKNGLMTWKEKLDLKYACEWKGFTGKEIGSSLTKGMSMWVNPGLRLVYLNFNYPNCPYLKNEYKTYGTKNFMQEIPGDNYEIGYLVRPARPIWAPTNNPNIIMGVDNGAIFYLRSYTPVTQNTTINGSLMWFYGDKRISAKINT